MSILTKIHHKLIKLVVGNTPVIMNCRINGGIDISYACKSYLIANNHLIGGGIKIK